MAKKEDNKINPLDSGVTYKEFIAAIGNTSIDEYLKGVCSDYDIAWIKTEIENYKNNLK